MILLHILGGLVGLASGAVALSAPKGARLHRRSGTIFVYAMMVLSASGAVMAALKPERVSVIAGLLTFYLVLTALLTVRHRGQAFHWMDIAAMSFGLTVGITGVIFGLSTGEIDGPPPVMAFVFGAVALLAVFGDIRMLLARSLRGVSASRVTCGVCAWRCGSRRRPSFWGRRMFPESLQIMPLLCTPVLLVMLLMAYWLVRALFTQWRPRVRLGCAT